LSLVSWKLRCWLPPGVSRRIATPGFNRTAARSFPGNTQELFRKGGVRCDSVGIRLAGRTDAGPFSAAGMPWQENSTVASGADRVPAWRSVGTAVASW
jgi:hypothetical protein